MTIYKDSNDWPYEKNLDVHGITSRVDLAKLAVYNMIVGSSNVSRIHIEDILNIFLGLVQHPLNFVFFDSEYNCIFHLCRDPKHRDSFENYIHEEKRKGGWSRKCTFKFFSSLDKEEVNIALIYMNTKMEILYSKIDQCSVSEPTLPLTERGYISTCAQLFFERMWDSQKSAIQTHFISALYASIEEQKKKYTDENKKNLQENESENNYDSAGMSPKEHGVEVQRILNLLSNSMEGIRESTAFSHLMALDMENSSVLVNVPNQILAFRDYNLGVDYKRYNNLYNYSTRYVLSNSKDIIDQYTSVINDLRRYSKDPLSYKGVSIVRFGDIEVSTSRKRKLTQKLDELFWDLLDCKEYSSRGLLTEILASPVSDSMRTLVDPVYQTGLIHYNRIFEEAGLDRIDERIIDEVVELKEITLESDDGGYIKDLLRIVLLYYLISHVARRSSDDDFKAQDILCVMYPIKIRGVCWAVAVQPYVVKYTQLDYQSEDPEHFVRHGNQLLWISVFVLTSYLRRRQFSVIDRKCWGYASRYITNQINRCIGKFLKSEKSTKETVDDINCYMREISSYLPYSFPHFDIRKTKGEEGGYRGHEEIISDGKSSMFLTWDVSENHYFTPSQKWDRVSTRRFDDAIELAVNIARRDFMKMNMNKLTNIEK